MAAKTGAPANVEGVLQVYQSKRMAFGPPFVFKADLR